MILHNPVKMMRVAYQVRSAVDMNGICKASVDPVTQRRVLVSQHSLSKTGIICYMWVTALRCGMGRRPNQVSAPVCTS